MWGLRVSSNVTPRFLAVVNGSILLVPITIDEGVLELMSVMHHEFGSANIELQAILRHATLNIGDACLKFVVRKGESIGLLGSSQDKSSCESSAYKCNLVWWDLMILFRRQVYMVNRMWLRTDP